MLEVILPLITAYFEDSKSSDKLCTELIILSFHNRGILYHAFFINFQEFGIKQGLCNKLESCEGVESGMEVQERGNICMSLADSYWYKWLRCKESACNAGDQGFDPWVRKIL